MRHGLLQRHMNRLMSNISHRCQYMQHANFSVLQVFPLSMHWPLNYKPRATCRCCVVPTFVSRLYSLLSRSMQPFDGFIKQVGPFECQSFLCVSSRVTGQLRFRDGCFA